ncbi:MAG: serine hydrolase domain-containing protein [Steroidobacteraceae bacterium]
MLLALLVFTTNDALGASLTAAKRKALDGILHAAMRNGPYPGLGVAVEINGQVVYARSMGFADLQSGTPFRRDTCFPIGSITKSFTALATLQLVAQRKILLDEPVGRYVKDLPKSLQSIAVRHLLNHTSGIVNYTDQPGFPIDSQSDLVPAQVLGYVADKPLQFKPGTRFYYSNTDSYLLGLVIEQVSGLSYANYVQTHVLEPFGMKHTHYADFRDVVAHRSRGYTQGAPPQAFAGAPQYTASVAFSAGALQSTVDDLLRYRKGVFDSAATGADVRHLVVQTDSLADGTLVYYALGSLIVRDFAGHRKISHSGVIAGSGAHYAYYPDDHLTIIVAGNMEDPLVPPYSVERTMARVLLNIPGADTHSVQPTAAELAAFAGEFDVQPFQFETDRLGFVAKDGQLNMRYGAEDSGAPLSELVYQGQGRFYLPPDTEHTFQFELGHRPARRLDIEFFDGYFSAQRREH